MFVLHLIFFYRGGDDDGERHGDDVCVVYAFVQIFSWFSFRILFTRTVFRDAIGKKSTFCCSFGGCFSLDNFQNSHFGFYLQRIRFLVACCHHNQYQQPLLMPPPPPPPSPPVLLLFSYCWWCCCLFVACSRSSLLLLYYPCNWIARCWQAH